MDNDWVAYYYNMFITVVKVFDDFVDVTSKNICLYV